MKNNVISWVFLHANETLELSENQKIIGTHLAPPDGDEDDEYDDYSIVLVIENEGGLK